MQPAESVRRLSKDQKSAKTAAEKQADMGPQVAHSSKTAEDALRWLSDTLRLVKLLEEEALGLKRQLRKMVKARDFAAAKSSNWQRYG